MEREQQKKKQSKHGTQGNKMTQQQTKEEKLYIEALNSMLELVTYVNKKDDKNNIESTYNTLTNLNLMFLGEIYNNTRKDKSVPLSDFVKAFCECMLYKVRDFNKKGE